jgi:hypothetical protein
MDQTALRRPLATVQQQQHHDKSKKLVMHKQGCYISDTL